MKPLADRKTRLVFETADLVFDAGRLRQVIVEAHPRYADFRLKGTRRSYRLAYSVMYARAVKLAVENSAPKGAKR